MRRGEEDDEDEHDGAAWSAAAFTRLSAVGHQVFGTSIGVKAPSMGCSFRPQPIPDAEFRHKKPAGGYDSVERRQREVVCGMRMQGWSQGCPLPWFI